MITLAEAIANIGGIVRYEDGVRTYQLQHLTGTTEWIDSKRVVLR